MNNATVFISGVHSDLNPSPGIGIAQSLREVFPYMSLTAVDYSVRSSGLHHSVFDTVLLQPAWTELDLPTYVLQIRRHLNKPNACWISGLDVETEWMAASIDECKHLLIPSITAQQMVRKPTIRAALPLGMQIPNFLPATAASTELHAMGRLCGWHLWVKGKYHEAYPAYSFVELYRQINSLQVHWPIEEIFIQEHISGLERCIVFAAYNGSLLDAVEVEKRSITSQGKTWAAAVVALPLEVRERLASLVADLCWTGGGEVEFIRDKTGNDWLIDFNPRFPAYIYGVTLCGHNLPALLVGTALGIEFAPRTDTVKQFIRVVQEIPVRHELPLPKLIETADNLSSVGKHPSFQPALVRRLRKVQLKNQNLAVQDIELVTLPKFLANREPISNTPLRLRDFSVAEALLDNLAGALEKCAVHPAITPALSVKTDPNAELAQSFARRKWWAEVISMREMKWALNMGFDSSQIVFNGPAVIELAASGGHRVAVAFADSLESFQILLKVQPCDIIGLRVRAGVATSRFGVDLTDFQSFSRVVNLIRQYGVGLRLGVHMHYASDACGPVRWRDFVEQALIWANALADVSNVEFSIFDVGGGWHSEDFQKLFIPNLPDLQHRITKYIPNLNNIIIELGKAVAADTGWLVTRVIEVRSSGSNDPMEVVVDASISDLPLAHIYAHRVLHLRNDRPIGWLVSGLDRVLGSICMEADILAEGVGFLQMPIVGDKLVFSSAGGYNASMAWHFAGGFSRDS